MADALDFSNPIVAAGIGLLSSNNPQDAMKITTGLLSQAQQQKRQEKLDGLLMRKTEAELERLENPLPKYTKVGNTLGQLNEKTGAFVPVFTAPDSGLTQYQQQMLDIKNQELELKKDPPPKPLPASVIKLQDDAISSLAIAKNINKDLSGYVQKIEKGEMDFGPIENSVNRFQNWIGASDQESINFGDFEASLQKLRNDSLRLNKGVQTEGDAQRAWDELIANINDRDFVIQRLQKIQSLNERAADLQKVRIDSIRNEFGADPFNYDQFDSGGSDGGQRPQGLYSVDDPLVKQALDEGYSMQEVIDFLNGQQNGR